jgi:hypothetical protein
MARKWSPQAQVDAGDRSGPSSEEVGRNAPAGWMGGADESACTPGIVTPGRRPAGTRRASVADLRRRSPGFPSFPAPSRRRAD